MDDLISTTSSNIPDRTILSTRLSNLRRTEEGERGKRGERERVKYGRW
jgi:hypothetical protein